MQIKKLRRVTKRGALSQPAVRVEALRRARPLRGSPRHVNGDERLRIVLDRGEVWEYLRPQPAERPDVDIVQDLLHSSRVLMGRRR